MGLKYPLDLVLTGYDTAPLGAAGRGATSAPTGQMGEFEQRVAPPGYSPVRDHGMGTSALAGVRARQATPCSELS
jgi:hypothetical protein